MTVPNPITSFADCGFPDYLMTDTEVRNAGFVEPTDPSPGLLHRPQWRGHGRHRTDRFGQNPGISPTRHHTLQPPALPGEGRRTHCPRLGTNKVSKYCLEL